MSGVDYIVAEQVLERAQAAVGIPLGYIDKTGRLATGKGAIGTVIEESWFGYRPNSESEPDFPKAKVELKVTPYIKGKNGIRAKERLVCNIINYMEEYNKTFYTSSFWHKCSTILLMTYEHLKDIPKTEYHIDAAILFRFSDEDLIIIEQDWEKIIGKVRSGKAHELSEGDTLYLAACTKGANANSVRKQPFSEELAKQRAYSLKASYMTQVINKYVFGDDGAARIIRYAAFLKNSSFEGYVQKTVCGFYGKTQSELKRILEVESNSKSLNEILLARMFGIKGLISNTEEFKKANIVPKTIRVEQDGSIRESMSFPTFDFIELSKEQVWEESKLYNMLAPTKFLFVIFVKNSNGEYVFDRIQFWNIPNSDLEEVYSVWMKTKMIINRGVNLVKTTKGVSNDLPKKTENRVAHVRPHGRDASDTLLLPDGRSMTKQCFWLNNTYIQKQILFK